MLELQKDRMEFETDTRLREIELALKAKDQEEKNRMTESKEIINALDKIKNLSDG